MQSTNMQPLSGKELEYIVDSISNEELLLKQCAATAASIQHPAIQQACLQLARTHEHHLNLLSNALQQHQQLAPMQPQQ
ncbi:hypothetical protein ACYCS5_22350 [Paenibacillus sp. SEL3]|uniref:Spore coat protein n=3 Tax=Paenibacillus TaxID=44249 RepID=E3EFI5_PAEPS|nr:MULTISPECIES: hypothetical protein [Paenibacillus]MCV9949033.1 hypothetical protein [Paenibacillus sp. BT-177]ADO55476.1 hypothetical protein PPSC2_07175 [Paenibacillus polymyxa SC2]AJE50407.1 hypothetical protein RE92_04710 [Paenibacillus polymyxa]AUO05149.1 hypothetical protein C0638_00490 [Paenibacillus sp. lzh-N1]AZH28645.1 hypothetical protein EGM68_07640 [Paenibacillus sp. M-152]